MLNHLPAVEVHTISNVGYMAKEKRTALSKCKRM